MLEAFKQKVLDKESEITKKDQLLAQANANVQRLQTSLKEFESNANAKELEMENARLLSTQYERDKQHRLELKQLEEKFLAEV